MTFPELVLCQTATVHPVTISYLRTASKHIKASFCLVVIYLGCPRIKIYSKSNSELLKKSLKVIFMYCSISLCSYAGCCWSANAQYIWFRYSSLGVKPYYLTDVPVDMCALMFPFALSMHTTCTLYSVEQP